MENKRGSEIFLGVVGVATLLVAIIGATFAYFSASAVSNEDAIKVQATQLSLGYADDNGAGLKSAMIPATYGVAKTAAFLDRSGAGFAPCIDDNGNQVCSVYRFMIGNPNATTKMTIAGSIKAITNEFTHLSFALWEGNVQAMSDIKNLGEPLVDATVMPSQGQSKDFDFTKDLIGFSGVKGTGFDIEDPRTYQQPSDKSNGNNVVEYTMLIWINEAGEGNVAEAGKMFAAGITFATTGEDGVGGVTGIIAGAMDDEFDTSDLTPTPAA